MSTTMPKANEIERKWYVIDAQGKPLGKTAAKAAEILNGKHKVDFAPHVDCGDFVIIINAEKAVLTGAKADKKIYYHHTGYIGNLKQISAGDLMKKNPEKAMTLAIKGMLPSNTIGRKSMTRLRVYRGAEHNNAAQKPEVLEF
ncbi:MAG: 50S ribosomal protein L13 [Clostridia bacterium]|nr:50S ribosomal protein L13 [Oscillospiraceae bacterium]MBR0413842.1 50S ribosomal protein L13 [Clostridia bacterium]